MRHVCVLADFSAICKTGRMECLRNYPAAETPPVQTRIFRALGTLNTIRAYGDAPADALERAEKRVLELDDALSVFKPESDIARLNAAAGQKSVRVGKDALQLLAAAKRFSRLTGGAFSVTTRPLSALWSLHAGRGTVPDRTQVERALELADDEGIILNEADKTAMLARRGQAADLGGIAKGYAADEVRRILSEGGVTDAMINLGGTVCIVGHGRSIGIQHPDRCTGIPMGKLTLQDRAIVTSGDYERYYEVDGVRYHHILDPKTGFPAQSGLHSVSVIGEDATALDALSTAIFVLGAKKGALLAAECGVELVLVTQEMNVYCSDALRGMFSLLSAPGGARVFRQV